MPRRAALILAALASDRQKTLHSWLLTLTSWKASSWLEPSFQLDWSLWKTGAVAHFSGSPSRKREARWGQERTSQCCLVFKLVLPSLQSPEVLGSSRQKHTKSTTMPGSGQTSYRTRPVWGGADEVQVLRLLLEKVSPRFPDNLNEKNEKQQKNLPRLWGKSKLLPSP